MNNEKTLGLLRHVLTFMGGILVAKGIVDESMLTDLVGAVITLVGGAWSILAKK